jgi:hypothetical protein
MAKEVKIPNKVQGQIQSLLVKRVAAESNFQMYVQGYVDSLELDGDWNLDTNKWVLVKMPKEAKEK